MDDSSDCLISGAPDTADYSENTDKPETAAMTANEQPLFFMDKVASKLPVSETLSFRRSILNFLCGSNTNRQSLASFGFLYRPSLISLTHLFKSEEFILVFYVIGQTYFLPVIRGMVELYVVLTKATKLC